MKAIRAIAYGVLAVATYLSVLIMWHGDRDYGRDVLIGNAGIALAVYLADRAAAAVKEKA